ncbi:Folylpolyglutamate synthetase [Akanthomyces lecanii RCEF 1005]|uniref:Folylpolyglutamate synthase n=1 Tax=Akanthomyces lecanii RCEF 1005 TaxID=1081108 RepID=A0A168K0R1_CORDF|nr:Folylpolyglutamate synthetase [Akanthomyces lecanii RCEF 1005]
MATSPTTTRSYNDAIDALNTLQTPYEVIEARRKAGVKPDAASIKEMRTYLNRIGYSVRRTPFSLSHFPRHVPAHSHGRQTSDLDRLNIIHVAGTKGKGSTCAFVDSILAEYRQKRSTPSKSGLFISPHLIAVRERIRINSAPISEALFARYFFEVWDRLESSTLQQPDGDDGSSSPPVPFGSKPIYGRYLTLVSWHAFLQENVDVAVYETGVGGEFDATNLVPRPLASGISTLGIDHVYVLGDTVTKIAWHKAGIMKTGSPAFTVEQFPEAADVLRARAADKHVALTELPVDPRLEGVRIKPMATFQKRNASLAIALAETALDKLGVETGARNDKSLPQEFVDGLEKTSFRGRCEVKAEDGITWHVDGAHTADSLKVSAKWFASETENSIGPRVLIFNQQGRAEAVDFLASIHAANRKPSPSSSSEAQSFDHAIFCTNVTYAATGYKRDFVNRQVDPKDIAGMTAQRRFAEEWARLDPNADVHVIPTIQEALDSARRLGEGLPEGSAVQAYVTGSLHLVGGALGILEQADAL